MRGGIFTRIHAAPEIVFLIAALVGGLILVALIPPVAGGNEQMNFRRVASIANGHVMVEPAVVPGGIREFLEITERKFSEGARAPYGYSRSDLGDAAAVKLNAEKPAEIRPNPISILNPVSYVPQAPAVSLAQTLGASPLAIFYAGRLAGLIAAIALTFFAVRIIPFHKHTLAAVALLPPLLFSRSTVDGDVFTVGIAFLFLAMAIREIVAPGRIAGSTIAALALAAFLLAQAKSAYFLLPLLVLAIPKQRFGGTRGKLLACSLICIPGILASLAWMVTVKQTYLAGMTYRTWSGIVAPDEQMALVLSAPLGFLVVIARTLFATLFIPKSLIEVLGVFGPPVMAPLLVIAALALLLGGTAASDRGATEASVRQLRVRTLAAVLAGATLLIILTALYTQWTRVGGTTIHGFNGRYLYPLAPLLLLAIPSNAKRVFGLGASAWLGLLATVSVPVTCWVTWATYWN